MKKDFKVTYIIKNQGQDFSVSQNVLENSTFTLPTVVNAGLSDSVAVLWLQDPNNFNSKVVELPNLSQDTTVYAYLSVEEPMQLSKQFKFDINTDEEAIYSNLINSFPFNLYRVDGNQKTLLTLGQDYNFTAQIGWENDKVNNVKNVNEVFTLFFSPNNQGCQLECIEK